MADIHSSWWESNEFAEFSIEILGGGFQDFHIPRSLERWSNWNDIFEMGWNHQSVGIIQILCTFDGPFVLTVWLLVYSLEETHCCRLQRKTVARVNEWNIERLQLLVGHLKWWCLSGSSLPKCLEKLGFWIYSNLRRIVVAYIYVICVF